MKKIMRSAFIILVCAALVLSFTACAAKPAIEEEVVEVPLSEELAAFVESIPEEKYSLPEESNLKLEVEVVGKSVVFKYTFNEDAEIPVSAIKENLSSVSGNMLKQLEELRTTSGCEIDSLILEYYSFDSVLVAFMEYKD